ncbi:folate-binding protein [Salipiger sp. IMCC34102]|uniref:CAF17-like 4Fe-4S cluster assembly/insertion protein YgfZ n=1 Tax=Salipiger sp. IMCC34102 TaxID=2510647 RepID=UPI00101C44A4|nr:folate-binding protein YgfZ [Salipiger sp. IMCC34102]RYH02238.1 folate-binding protein [Salipiger sp. IMCC34102]
MTDRTVLALTGADRVDFLQGLVTNDITRDGLIYAALLTPQGKYLADFFVLDDGPRLLIDVATEQAAGLGQRLSMYRLRADVVIETTDLVVSRGVGPAPEGARPDPRDPALGWRLYSDRDVSEDVDWDALRVSHLIPEAGRELTPETYILEVGFERLNGVDFRKGCFVGQEIVARMKHKTTLRKGLVAVKIDGSAQPGDEITSDGRAAGVLHTVSGFEGLAYLRFDRAEGARTKDADLTVRALPTV